MNSELIKLINKLNKHDIELIHYTPLSVCVRAIRTSHDSHHKSDNCGIEDLELIHRVGNMYKHASVLEHLVYTFDINGISRAVLQKFMRHRISSATVQSTQYTLKRLGKLPPFPSSINLSVLEALSKYIYLLDSESCIHYQIFTINKLIESLREGTVNDSKYILPESYKSRLVFTINGRSLQNFLALRTPRSAMFPEVRALAFGLFQNLPNSHKYIYDSFIKNSEDFNNSDF